MTGEEATRGSSRVVLRPLWSGIVTMTITLVVFAGGLLLVAAAVALDPHEDQATRRWLPSVLLLFALPMTIAAVRLPRMGVVADEEGVVERYVFRTRRFSWEDIEGIDFGPSMHSRVPGMAVWLRTRGGRRCLESTARARTIKGEASVADAIEALAGHPGFRGTAVVPAPASEPERRRALRTTLATVILGLTCAAVSFTLLREDDPPENPNAGTLTREEGDCYQAVPATGQSPRDPAQIGFVVEVECAAPHHGEVTHVEERGARDGLATIEERCDAAVPLPADSPFVVRHQTSVDDGRLRIVCAVERRDGALTTGHVDLDPG